MLALAACGGGGKQHAATQPGTDSRAQCAGSKLAVQRQRARARLNADLVQLRQAAATVRGHTQVGNAKLDAALNRFSLDVAKPTLPVHQRSRFIDHAAAIVAPKCYLCFQTLESNRPIAAGAKLTCD